MLGTFLVVAAVEANIGRSWYSTRKVRGFSLLATFLVTGVVSTLAMTLAVVCVFQLSVSQGMVARQTAQNLAESAVAMTASRLMRDARYGRRVEVRDGEGLGLVTFQPGDKQFERPLITSVNNLEGNSPVPGSLGREVPPGCAQVVGIGICAGAPSRVEVLLYKPQFIYAIATSGQFKSEGSLLVGSVRGNAELAEALKDPDKLHPGHLASNSSQPEAVSLSDGADVRGDVRAVGGVKLDANAKVKGKVTPGSAKVEIPTVTFEDPTKAYANQTVQLQGNLDTTSLKGFNRRSGSLTVNGDLDLNGGVLYVDGDLDIKGAVKGRGAIYVNGKTTVRGGGSALGADHQLALVSKSDVTILGNGMDVSQFAGVIYTEGKLKADDITLVGAFIGNGPESKTSVGSTMDFKNVRVIENPDGRKLDLSVEGPPAQPAPTPVGQGVDNSQDPSLMSSFGWSGDWVSDWVSVYLNPPDISTFYDPKTDTYTTDGHRLQQYVNFNARRSHYQFGFQSHDGYTGPYDEVMPKLQTDGRFARLAGRADAHAQAQMAYLRKMVADYNTAYQKVQAQNSGGGPRTDWSFDLNKFLNLGGGVRQLLWRRL